ncbi:MAG TPA: lipid-binding SYLF domain-containing protein [Bryobacteraceae bacterium]|nr:lipid-binding SYLF domain-containing protein [Bryobacteraceae bacterium]
MRILAFASMLLASSMAFAAETPERIARIQEAAKVMREIMQTSDKGIPKELLEDARCVVIVPGLKKAGFIVGGNYGKGVMTCRVGRRWSAPSTVRIEGGSFGAQIGGGEVDVIMLVMSERGAEAVMKDKFTVGGEVGAMAGPVGRSASANTDPTLRSGILSYSRSRGLFAGIALNGSTLRPDDEDNAEIYGRKVSHQEILMGKVPPPPAAAPLYAVLGPSIGTPNTGTRARTPK